MDRHTACMGCPDFCRPREYCRKHSAGKVRRPNPYTSCCGFLRAAIGAGSSVAFNDIVSITVVGLYASYFSAISLLLWRRLTDAIRPEYEAPLEPTIINAPNTKLTWGPFKLPGILGPIINAVSLVYITIIFIFAFWPPAQPVTPSTMNYACLVFGATILGSISWYLAYARKTFNGPIVEI